ncbi:hypothetical protein [Microtetraspora fusca]|uniref:Uncharacterized protein n=1 Tax=Microtetraspora fusca TaxID=1997 RepID=A0ABW6V9K8_MICFU|nr:hypothetical protein [Microtetraspora fusca]
MNVTRIAVAALGLTVAGVVWTGGAGGGVALAESNAHSAGHTVSAHLHSHRSGVLPGKGVRKSKKGHHHRGRKHHGKAQSSVVTPGTVSH